MKIDQRMNLVIPIDIGGGVTIHAHSTPISEETFDQHFLLIGKTHAGIYGEGLGELGGPRLAAKMMKRISINMETQPGRIGQGLGYAAVIAEIRRTTMVCGPDGMVTLQEAVDKNLVDKTDIDVLENAIVFFIAVSAMLRPADLRVTLDGVCGLWGARLSSLNSTDFNDSLRKSTAIDNSGAKAAASRVPG